MSFKSTSIFFFSFIFIISGEQKIQGQAPNFQKFNFTIEDGLPSNECHDVVQDSIGYVWIATDRGLSRFDGYGFRNYGFQDGLRDLSCLDLFIDSKNDIWINTLSKKIFKYLSKTDTIVEIEYSNHLQQFKDSYPLVEDLYVNHHGTLHIVVPGFGIILIDQNGTVSHIRSTNKYNASYPFFIDDVVLNLKDDFDELGIIKNIAPEAYIQHPTFGLTRRTLIGCQNEEVIPKLSSSLNVIQTNTNLTMFKLDNQAWFASIYGTTHIFEDCFFISYQEQDPIADFVRSKDGYYSVSSVGRKLEYYDDKNKFLNNQSEIILSGAKYTRVLVDKNYNIFVTTADEGFFYLKQPDIKSLDFTQGKEIYSITTNNDERIYLNIDKKDLFEYDLLNDSFTSISINTAGIWDIEFDQDENRLIIAGSGSYYHDLRSGLTKKINLKYEENKIGILNSKKILKEDSNAWLFLSPWYFNYYNRLDSVQAITSYDRYSSQRVFDALKHDDGFLFGKIDGLYFWNKDSIQSKKPISPLFNQRINALERIRDTVLIGTTGNGLILWDGENKFENITTNDGLISNNIENILVNKRGQIICGTYSGISIIDRSENRISNYNSTHGLPSNQVFDLAELNGDLYVGTSNGLGIIQGEKKSQTPKAATIKTASLSDAELKLNETNSNFSHRNNNLSVSYVALDYELLGNITYRYRLNDSDWVESNSTSVNYPDLHPGDYRFELSSQNKDELWSKAVGFDFHICYPWYKQWYFNLGIAIISLLLLYLFYKRSIDKLKKENAIKEEIRDLEKAALQAQMNPHFIFNCLNSIQSFIMSNEKELAMEYLSKFAKLIRQNLNASVETKITLKEEIQMLENYLELEKLRHNDVFDYIIIVDKNLDQVSSLISPLLVQPFVENAVLHGMKGKESEGLIELSFAKVQDKMEIKIKDNGNGINLSSHHKRKSLGNTITHKRIKLLNESSSIHTLPQISTGPSGTEVCLSIML